MSVEYLDDSQKTISQVLRGLADQIEKERKEGGDDPEIPDFFIVISAGDKGCFSWNRTINDGHYMLAGMVEDRKREIIGDD